MKKKGSIGKAGKIVLIVLLAIIVLLFGGGFAYYSSILNSPQPQIDGNLRAKGLNGSVEVIRDANGIPHIYAKNMHDLFFAQGYAQAQDRWWQMEFFRKTCGGRIEELTGKKAGLVNTDIYLRSLGLYDVCKKAYDLYTPDQRAPLDAFAEGVNAYISGRSPDQLSVNYSILGLTGVKFKVEHWTAMDTLAFGKLMAWDLGLSRDLEITRTKLYSLLGAEMAEKWLVPAWPIGQKPTTLLDDDIQALEKSAPPVTPATSATSSQPLTVTAGQTYEDASIGLKQLIGEQAGAGSNSWVATGSMTQSGKALMANDPHLGIQQPSIWYEVDLHCIDDGSGQPFDEAGFTFATFPGVVAGHNSYIAWGETNVYPDVNDQYIIKVNPDNPLQYEWNGKWRDMTVREEKISFGDGKPAVNIKVRLTHLGPITNDNKYDSKTGEPGGYNNKDPLALHWTALEPSRIALAILALGKARNWDDFRSALKDWDVPSQSIIYADTKGNIGYQMPGKVPIRPQNYAGQVPAPGWTSEYEWKGYIPYDLMPRTYNPSRNFIVAANQEVAPPDYYEFLNQQLGPDVNANFGSKYNKWVYGYRSQRIYELIKQLAPNTVATYQSIQSDNKYLPADELLPYLAKLKFDDADVSDARDWLLKWDRFCSVDSPQTALYAEFWMKLNNNIFQNKMGDAAKADGVDREMWAVNLLLQNPSDPWWDDPATKDIKETRDDVLIRSFKEGYAATVTALGKDRGQWKWGSLHKATPVSNPLGASGIGLIESLVNCGPVPAGGNSECVDSNEWYASNGNFSIRLIPSMRIIVDMSDLSKGVSMNSTGQSGHPGNPWYGDMLIPWSKVQYHPMLWTRQQVEAGMAHKLNLNP
ncbi:MAG: penicillin acylase family protein [Chloroflexi bacterium]|nr:penicillin acylase family protein [Chloroflexota bacterium]